MNIFLYLVQSTICLAFFYAFYLFALQKETTFKLNRLYLLFTLVISISLPFVKFYIDALDAQPIVYASQVVIGPYLDSFENIVITAEHKERISWLSVFFWVYLAGVLVLSTRFFIELWNLRQIKNTGQQLTISGSQCVLADKVRSPFSFFRTIFLPVDHKFNEEELSEVIRHEQTHITGRHSIDILVMELASIALWMNPFIYLYRRKLRELHEFLADAAVLKHSDWEQYAQFLLSQKNYGLQHQLSNQLVYSQLKNRIIMMTQKRSLPVSKFKYLGIVPILLAATVMFSFREKGINFSEAEQARIDTLPTTYITALKLHDPTLQGEEPKYADSKWNYTRGMPVFPGCENVPFAEMGECGMMKLTDFINANMKYPATLRKAGIEGRVVVKFTVGADGLVKNIAVDKSLHPDADKAAMEVFEIMNQKAGKWQPAAENGIVKDAEMWLPITFSLDNVNYKVDNLTRKDVYTYVEQMPRFGDCKPHSQKEWVKCNSEALYNFINEHISYPAEARKNGIKGMVLIQFIIEADGEMSNIQIIRGVSPELDKEALRVVNLMNEPPQKWIPGYDNGKPVAVSFTLPITFKLDENKIDTLPRNDVFTYVEQMPNFSCDFLPVEERGEKCSTTALFSFINSAIKYPKKDREQGNEGMVIVRFIVEVDGTVSNVSVVRGVSPGLNEEAIRVIHSMNDLPYRWTPGIHHGKPVPVQFTLPFKFVLQSDQRTENKSSSTSSDSPVRIGFDKPKKEESLSNGQLYPNPTTISINIEAFKGAHTFRIFDLSGKLHITQQIPKSDFSSIHNIDISRLKAGQYVLHTISDNETKTMQFGVIR